MNRNISRYFLIIFLIYYIFYSQNFYASDDISEDILDECAKKRKFGENIYQIDEKVIMPLPSNYNIVTNLSEFIEMKNKYGYMDMYVLRKIDSCEDLQQLLNLEQLEMEEDENN